MRFPRPLLYTPLVDEVVLQLKHMLAFQFFILQLYLMEKRKDMPKPTLIESNYDPRFHLKEPIDIFERAIGRFRVE